MADLTEKPWKIDSVCWRPDGSVLLSGSTGYVTTRFVVDPESWRKIVSQGRLGAPRRRREGRGVSEFSKALAHSLFPLRRGLCALVAVL
jgi:hypothetical protein